MALDESLILLFVPACRIMFVGERFEYGFRKSFMSSIVAPRKILTLTEFLTKVSTNQMKYIKFNYLQ